MDATSSVDHSLGLTLLVRQEIASDGRCSLAVGENCYSGDEDDLDKSSLGGLYATASSSSAVKKGTSIM